MRSVWCILVAFTALATAGCGEKSNDATSCSESQCRSGECSSEGCESFLANPGGDGGPGDAGSSEDAGSGDGGPPDAGGRDAGAVSGALVLSTPINVKAVPGIRSAEVSWGLSPTQPTGVLTAFEVKASPGGVLVSAVPTARSAQVTGLANGTSYTFTVTAVYADGSRKVSSVSSSVRTSSVPGAPSWSSWKTGDQQVTLNWRVPSDGGQPIQGYSVTLSPGGQPLTTTETTVTLTGLTNGATYGVSVVAINAVGSSSAATLSALVPTALPSAPVRVSAAPLLRAATVYWAPPASTGGGTLSGYVITTQPGGMTQTVSGTATSATLSGLVNGGVYTFSVAAQNSTGTGPATTSTEVTLPDIPSAPVNLTGVFSQGRVELDWLPPVSDGRSALTGYKLTSSPAGAERSLPTTPTVVSITGLALDVSYTFTLVAVNAVGEGPSVSSAPILTRPQPKAPTDVRVTSTVDGVVVRWNQATAPEGDPVTEYLVTASPGGVPVTVAGDTLVATVTGLPSGTQARFHVTARNSAGRGRPSAPVFHRHVTPLACETPSFAPISGHSYGSPLNFVGAGDFTGDGQPDVVVGATYRVAVMANEGRRSFSRRELSASAQATFLDLPPVVADFNKDGKLDVAAILFADSTHKGGFVLYPGNGDGTFLAPITTNTALNTTLNCMASGDFNSDGTPDVLAHTTGNQIVLYRGLGNGSFASPTTIVSSSGYCPIVADFNRDGFLDYARIDGANNRIVQANGTGTGTFKTPSYVPCTTCGGEAVVGDFDKDGARDDVAIIGRDRVRVFNTPSGTLSLLGETILPDEGGIPTAIPIAVDLDGDAVSDLLWSTNYDRHLHVLPGSTTAPPFAPLLTYGFSGEAYTPAAGDFDGDGRMDVVLTGDFMDMRVFWGGPLMPESLPLEGAPGGLAQGDFNRDGSADLAAGSIAKNAIHLSLSGGASRGRAMLSPVYVPPTGSTVTGGVRDLVAGDLDEDGQEDLAAITTVQSSTASNQLVVFKRLPSGEFDLAVRYPEDNTVYELIKVDLNEDGRFDLVTLSSWLFDKDSLGIWLNQGNGRFAAQPRYALSSERGTSGLVAADLDRDGHMDLALLRGGQPIVAPGLVHVLWGNGAGGFAGTTTFTGTPYMRNMGRADLDGQGLVGLVVDNGEMGFLTFDAARQPVLTLRFDSQDGAGLGLIAEDFNSDGRTDVFSNSSYAPKLWLQQSGGAFSPARLPSWGSAVQDALVADWNGDGLTDLAFTDTEAKSATLMLNVCLP
ncbi:hypothetical protein MYSTI_04596 [Myxococcus stipitatus DSM 14675]|uniref:Fibronectin type-III domain-containing protein n=1 Tax=Myxococcus stipitatus (strain DSM 14675 / JCM 12634 / Mx s8) TaxID=1278073 RepID=L7UCX2_MYXSD|nr:FG-GAP-like repeat-containing protein [Myxococcus stipitatus]AGC45888.1 hypothetical protein MYSTI_04596 [Myxococcus stipitatus DSM 14675]